VSNMKEMLGFKHVLCWLLSQHDTCLLSHMRAWGVVHMVVEKDTALWSSEGGVRRRHGWRDTFARQD
jgi:hypothetical protein